MESRKGLRLPKRVHFHDITLRDGEQQTGVVFRRDEKVKIAKLLDEVGISRIEAGMPAVSDIDKQAVREIAHLGLNASVYSFARCMRRDVDLARECDVEGVVMEIPSSDHILKYAYGWPEDRAIELATDATLYAHEHGLKVTFFTIDSTRATFPSCWRLVNAVAKNGHMDSLTLVDTFGVCSPEAIKTFVRKIKTRVNKPLEIHCHNDFGLGVANTLAAVGVGVETVHTTVNGIGERMGNTCFEETAIALQLLYGVETGIKFEKLRALSKMVEELSSIRLPPQKPVVGGRIFAIESGIIAGWWHRLKRLNMPLEIFPYLPNFVGAEPIRVEVGKKSGRDSIAFMNDEYQLGIPEEEIDNVLLKVKEKAISEKRTLTREEFLELTGASSTPNR